MTTPLRMAFDRVKIVSNALQGLDNHSDLAHAEGLTAALNLLLEVLDEKQQTMDTCTHCRTLYVLSCSALMCMQLQVGKTETDEDLYNLFISAASLVLDQLELDFQESGDHN